MSRLATLVASAIYAASAALAAAAPSSIALPIEIELAGFVSDAERELPKTLASGWEMVGRTVKVPVAYRFDLQRGPIELAGDGDRVRIFTKIYYKVDVGVPGPTSQRLMDWRRVNGCQPRKPVIVSLDTRLEFTPDWQLKGRSTPRLEMPEPCRLSAARELVNIDLSDRVRLAFLDGMYRAAADFDRRLAAQGLLREWAARAWTGLAAPLPLGERAWLMLNPAEVRVMRPTVADGLIRTGVVVTGQPRIQSEPLAPPPAALPPLTLTEAGGAFQMDWRTELTWSELVLQMRETLVGEQVRVSGRRTVRIEDIDLAPLGDRVLITASVSGGVKGRIQLTGRPQVDAATRTMAFADLDFTVDTDNFLVRVADWFRHEGTRKKLTAMSRVDVAKALETARARVETALRSSFGESLRLEGGLDVTEPFAVTFDEASVRLEARLTGTLTLRLIR